MKEPREDCTELRL